MSNTLPGRVTVLIPTFNRAHYLSECLESILAQTVPPFEVIVVDDGSGDSTPETVAAFEPAVRYLHKANEGKARAINFALPEAKGDYLWIFDDDDVALPDAIERRLEVLSNRPELGFVLTGHYIGTDGTDGRVRRGREYVLPTDISEPELHLALMKGCFVTMQSMLVRTAILRRTGGFDPELARSQDYDMMLRLAALASFSLVHQPTFIFRQHEGVRGPAGHQHESSQRQRLFRKYDAIVGRKLRSTTELGGYLVPTVGDADLRGARLIDALLARMDVMASKGLVSEMFEDLTSALQHSVEVGVDTASVARRSCDAICTGYAYDAIADDFSGLLTLLVALKMAPGGRRAILQIARGVFRLAKSYPGTHVERVLRLGQAIRIASHAM